MSRRLPPLNALRAFEAAARLGGFTAAAEELHVTPAAISHQIKALEDWLETPLFRRLNREVQLTRAGRAALPPLTRGFDALLRGVEAAQAESRPSSLAVSASPSLTAKWLMPRLPRFMDAHPDIEVRVMASAGYVDLARDDVDCALRYGSGPTEAKGVRAEPLFADHLFPVCAPNVVERIETLPLLVDETANGIPGYPGWAGWFAHAGREMPQGVRIARFSHAQLALDAAQRGQGLALGRTPLVASELRTGQLVRPVPGSLPGLTFNVLTGPDAPAPASAFIAWLKQEAALFVAEWPDLTQAP